MKKLLTHVVIPTTIFLVTLSGLLFLTDRGIKNDRLKRTHTYALIQKGSSEPFKEYVEFQWQPNSKIRAMSHFNGKKIYDVVYSTDANGLRSPEPKFPGVAREHLILAGCSFVYGEGLPISETVGHSLENRLPEINTYIIAFQGAGLSSLLRYMEVRPLNSFIPESRGRLIYVYMHDHLARWHARPSYLVWTPLRRPHYEAIGDEVVYKGNIGDQEAYRRFHATSELTSTDLAAKFHGVDDGQWSADEIKSFIMGLKESQKRYKRIFPDGEYLVAVHPIKSGPRDVTDRFVELARKAGLQVHDVSGILERELQAKGVQDVTQYIIPNDGHPNGMANEYFSRWIEETFYRKSEV